MTEGDEFQPHETPMLANLAMMQTQAFWETQRAIPIPVTPVTMIEGILCFKLSRNELPQTIMI